MLTAINKGVKAAEVSSPPKGIYEEFDLRVLPSFISYKAAMAQERTNLKYIIALLMLVWASTFIVQNNRIDYWQTKYREKEFILVPSKIIGHTPAVPQNVPKEYVKNAIRSFVQLQGTTTPGDIKSQLERFASYMKSSLASKYLAQMESWIELSEKKKLYEQIEITRINFDYNKSGVFDAEIVLKRDRRENSTFLGTATEKVEMTIAVQQPKPGQEWAFQINKFQKRTL